MKLLWRYVLAWMGCLGIMNVYFCRINLSVAMVAMVGVEQVPADNVTETSSTCKARWHHAVTECRRRWLCWWWRWLCRCCHWRWPWKLAVTIDDVGFRLSCSSIFISEVVAPAGKDRRENSSGANSNRLITSVIILSSSSVISSALNKLWQGLVTGSYYWSYAACQIPAAWLATKFGFRRVFGFSMLVGEM